MNHRTSLSQVVLLCLFLFSSPVLSANPDSKNIKLPAPQIEGITSVEQAIKERRSVRSFSSETLSLEHLSQILWAAQGLTSEHGYRAAPSAGALFPLEIFVVIGQAEKLAAGFYHYIPQNHSLTPIQKGDFRAHLPSLAYNQSYLGEGAAVLVFTGIYERTEKKYGAKAPQFVHIEVGHAAQNVYLQATALGLGTVMVGGFEDKKLQEFFGLSKSMKPLALMPIGHTQ